MLGAVRLWTVLAMLASLCGVAEWWWTRHRLIRPDGTAACLLWVAACLLVVSAVYVAPI